MKKDNDPEGKTVLRDEAVNLLERVTLRCEQGAHAIAAHARRWNERLGYEFKPFQVRISATKFLYETLATVLPFLLGIDMYVLFGRKMWMFAALVAFSSSLFVISNVRRIVIMTGLNRALQRLLEQQSAMALSILSDNDKLVCVARAAEDVRVALEVGEEPDLLALSRSLATIYSEKPARVN